jgi:hypothetical protein
MLRVIIGAAIAAVVMMVISFLIYMTPLSGIGADKVTTEQAAQLQQVLASTLQETGAYRVPDPNTAEQTGLHAQGPVATITYNAKGNANSNAAAMRYAYALVLNFLVALAIGAALIGLDRHGSRFGARARLALLFGFAAAAFMHLSRPIWLLGDWSSAIFGFLADGLAIGLGGVIVAWFIPSLGERQPAEAPREAPREV